MYIYKMRYARRIEEKPRMRLLNVCNHRVFFFYILSIVRARVAVQTQLDTRK